MNYSEFRKEYELQHPASVPKLRRELSEYPRWLRILVFVMFVCAALISGVHTMSVIYQTISVDQFISEELRQWISRMTLIAFETALFVTVYALVKDRQRWIAWSAGGTAFAVALLCNVKNTADNLQPDDLMDWVVTIAVGAGAPLIALLAGKMFVDMHRSERAQVKLEHDALYEAQLAFDKEVLAAFEVYAEQKKVEAKAEQKRLDRMERRTNAPNAERAERRTPNERQPSFVRSNAEQPNKTQRLTKWILADAEQRLALTITGLQQNFDEPVSREVAANAKKAAMQTYNGSATND